MKSFVFFVFLFSFSVSAQQPRFDASASVDIVSVPVTVTNSAGRFVFGLTRDDFEIRDDGERRPLTQFSAERVPVSLGILLDISGSMAQDPKARAVDDARWADTKRALELLVSKLDPRDEVLFAVFNEKVALASAWTQDHGRVLRAFDSVRPSGQTAFFEAVRSIAPAFQAAQHSRRVLLVISDGQDSKVPNVHGAPSISYFPPARGQNVQQRDREIQAGLYAKYQSERLAAIESTRQAVSNPGAAVYAIGMGTRRGASVNLDNLESLTRDTGGYVETLRDPAESSAAIARICDELQAQYFLAFESAHVDGRTHAILVSAKNRNFKVRAKSSYVATGK